MTLNQKRKRVYQQKMWDAATFYCKEAKRSHKAKAYFCALVARAVVGNCSSVTFVPLLESSWNTSIVRGV